MITGRPRYDLHELLKPAMKAAEAAGQIIANADTERDLGQIRTKGIGDFVTQVDVLAEEAILRILREAESKLNDADSGPNIVSEERSGGKQGVFTPNTWVVDPLDATSCLIHRAGPKMPAVLIAYYGPTTIELGVMYLPLSRDWYYAVRGQGAYRNHEPIRAIPARQLEEAWIDLNQYGDCELETVVFSSVRDVLRQSGGPSLVTMYPPHSSIVADIVQGPIDAVIHDNNRHKVKQAVWDASVPQIIIEEAGGVCHYLDGGRYNPWLPAPFIIARSAEFVQQVIAFLK